MSRIGFSIIAAFTGAVTFGLGAAVNSAIEHPHASFIAAAMGLAPALVATIATHFLAKPGKFFTLGGIAGPVAGAAIVAFAL